MIKIETQQPQVWIEEHEAGKTTKTNIKEVDLDTLQQILDKSYQDYDEARKEIDRVQKEHEKRLADVTNVMTERALIHKTIKDVFDERTEERMAEARQRDRFRKLAGLDPVGDMIQSSRQKKEEAAAIARQDLAYLRAKQLLKEKEEAIKEIQTQLEWERERADFEAIFNNPYNTSPVSDEVEEVTYDNKELVPETRNKDPFDTVKDLLEETKKHYTKFIFPEEPKEESREKDYKLTPEEYIKIINNKEEQKRILAEMERSFTTNLPTIYGRDSFRPRDGITLAAFREYIAENNYRIARDYPSLNITEREEEILRSRLNIENRDIMLPSQVVEDFLIQKIREKDPSTEEYKTAVHNAKAEYYRRKGEERANDTARIKSPGIPVREKDDSFIGGIVGIPGYINQHQKLEIDGEYFETETSGSFSTK